jgi:hypothetical protein
VELFATELADRAKGNKSIEIPLYMLFKWGEMPGSSNGTYSDRATSSTSFIQSMQDALSSILPKVSLNSIWSKLKLIISGQNGMMGHKKQVQAERPLKSTNNFSIPRLDHHSGQKLTLIVLPIRPFICLPGYLVAPKLLSPRPFHWKISPRSCVPEQKRAR